MPGSRKRKYTGDDLAAEFQAGYRAADHDLREQRLRILAERDHLRQKLCERNDTVEVQARTIRAQVRTIGSLECENTRLRERILEVLQPEPADRWPFV